MVNEKKPVPRCKNLSRIATGRVAIDAEQVRRGALFLVNIGVPRVVGAARGDRRRTRRLVVIGMLSGRHRRGFPASGNRRTRQLGR